MLTVTVARLATIGGALRLNLALHHFMGYRFGLFNYATKTAGGYADFDFFRISEARTGSQ